MNLFEKQFRRGSLFSFLLTLLLTAAMAFCSIGFAAWIASLRQLSRVASQYTTTAVPAGYGEYSPLLALEGKSLLLTQQKEHTYPGLLTEDVRGFLAAHVSGCASLSPYEQGDFTSHWFNAFNNSVTVLAVRCVNTDDKTDTMASKRAVFDDKGNIVDFESYYQRRYSAEFSLEEAVCRLPAYDVLPEDMSICLSSSLYTADGRIPFEVGKTYLLFGMDNGSGSISRKLTVEEGASRWEFEEPFEEDFAVDNADGYGSKNYDSQTGNMLFSWQEQRDADGALYYTLTEDSLPFYAEYKESWQAFLDTEEGTVWRERILPLCRINHESASVILTDNIDSMLLFNNGSASILEGRKFTAEEYAGGEGVCLVSAAYASKNGLSLGSKIQLDLYRSDLNYQMLFPVDKSEDFTPIWVQDPCLPQNRLGVQKDYTIVGIYTAPEFSAGWHSFQADTIFVPKASVPDASRYENRLCPLLYSVVLENGREDEFEEYLSSLGYGGLFVYFDQGYNVLRDSFSVISANALRLALSGCGAFLLAAALFLFLNFRRAAPVVRNMRLLGVHKKIVWKEFMQVLAAVILFSFAAGAGLAYGLYGTITTRMLKNLIVLQPQTLLLCAAAQALLLLLAAAVFSLLLADRRLMDANGGKKGNGGARKRGTAR